VRRRHSKNNYYIKHNFYCIYCGNQGIPVLRSPGHLHEKFHRKRLYCPSCKQVINHIECITPEEVEEFQKDFADGVYKDEAEKDLAFVRDSGIG
jgi:transcription elongation factor Elf1